MKRQREVDVYLRDCHIDRAVAWVRANLGPLVGPLNGGESVIYHLAAGAVVFTPGVEGERFLGVWFNTADRPWATDVECARAAAAALGCVVRCDPGSSYPDVHPQSGVFLEIDGTSERLVGEWADG